MGNSKGKSFLAGPEGIDCGTVQAERNPKAATKCALNAQSQGHPFRVVYELPGIDSFIAVGIVRTPTGQLFALTYDSDPMGGGWSRTREVVSKCACPSPLHLWVSSHGRLNCFKQ